MSFDLSALKFQVNTEELDAAIKKVAGLTTAVKGLTKPLKDVPPLESPVPDSTVKRQGKNLDMMGQAVKVFYKEQEKFAKQEQKLKEQMFSAGATMNDNAVKSYHKYLDDSTKAQQKATDKRIREMERETDALQRKTKKQQTILERQRDITAGIASGLSKGQASIVARAKAAGQGADVPEIITQVQTQQKFLGGEPFDKSVEGLRILKQELGQAREGFRQLMDYQKRYEAAKALGNGSEASIMALSKKETDNLYRDKLRAFELFKQEREILKANVAAKVSAAEITAKAGQEELQAQKVVFRQGLRDTENHYKNIANIKRPLENIRTVDATKRRDELNYLARATSVQLGDVGISLAGGQNPLTVFLQQGDQLRAVFNQVGASSVEMKDALSKAFSQIVVGFVDVAKVMGTFVVGAFLDASKAMVKFSFDALGVTALMKFITEGGTLLGKTFDGLGKNHGFTKFIQAVSPAALGLIAAGLTGIGVAAIATGAALYSIMKTSQDLSVALAMSGGVIAINKDEALKMAAAFASTSGTSMQVAGVITEIAKAGNISKVSIEGITKAALDLEKYGGIAVKDTVALYSKLADDPVKGLTELALKTGDVSQATIDHIANLVNQGASVQAVTEAIAEMNRVNGISAQTMYDDMSPLEKLWVDMKSDVTLLKEEIFKFANTSTVVDTLRSVWSDFARVIREVLNLAKQTVVIFNAIDKFNSVSSMSADKGKAGIELYNTAKAALLFDPNANRDTTTAKTVAATEAEKKYINVLQGGAIVRREINEADKAANIEGIKAGLAFKKLTEKYDNVSNLSPTGREKAKAAAIKEANALALASMKAHGADIVAIEKKQAETIANINEQYKPKKEAAAKKPKKPQDVKDMEAAIKFMDDSLERSSGKLPTYTEDIKKLELAFKSGKYGIVEFMMAKDAYEARQPAAIAKVREETEALKKYNAETEKEFENILAVNKARLSLNKESVKNFDEGTYKNEVQAKELAFREEMIGKTDEQKNLAKIAFEQEAELIEINRRKTSALIAEREKYNELLSKSVGDSSRTEVLKNDLAQAEARINSVAKGEVDNAAKKAQLTLKELNDAKLDKFSEGIADALITGMTEGAKAGKKKLRDLIVAELTKTITLNITANIKSLLSGGGSGGGLLDMLMGKGSDSLLSKGFDMLGGLFSGGGLASAGASSTFGAVTGTAGAYGMSAASGTGAAALAELSTGIVGLGTSATTAAAAATSAAGATAGFGSAALGVLGPIGLFAAGVGALFAIFGGGKDKIPTVLNDLALFNNSLIGLPFLELAIGSDEAAQGLRDVLYGLENASPTMRKLAGETVSLSVELLRATGDIAGAANLARNLGTRGMSEAEIAVYDYNQSLRDQIEAARAGAAAGQAAAQAEEQLAKTRWDLAGKLNILLGRTTQKEFDRATQLAATTDASSLEMLKLIYIMEDLTSAVDTQYAALERSIAKEKELADVRLKSAQELANALKTTVDSISPEMSRKTAQAQIAMYLTLSKLGASLPSLAAIKPALDAITRPSTDLFKTFEEYALDQARTANDIRQLSDAADKEVSEAQKTIDRLDKQLEAAKAQLDALKGVDNSVKDVATAIKDFDAAMRALGEAKIATGTYNPSAPVTGGAGGGGGYGGGGGAAAPAFEDVLGQDNKDIVAAYREYYNRNPDASGYKHFLESGLTGDKLMQAILGASSGDKNGADYKTAVSKGYDPTEPIKKYLKSILNPTTGAGASIIDDTASFAVGINNVPYDMVAQIHKGERILPAADNAELFARLQSPVENNAALITEIKLLRNEVSSLKLAANTTAANTGKTMRILDDLTVESGGDSLKVTVVT